MRTVRVRLAGWFELSGPDRNLAMEGLRGLAVTLVFFVHYHALFKGWLSGAGVTSGSAAFLAWVGHAGVDLFFVLSGYLIYGAVISRPTFAYGRFLWRRAERIYPTFIVLLSVYVLLSVLLPTESKLPPGGWAATAYVLANALLLPGMFPIVPLMAVAWSLSYEVFFYLTVPLLVSAARIRSWQVGARVAGALGLGMVLVTLSVLGAGHVQLIMFLAGVIVYELTQASRAGALRGVPGFGPWSVGIALASLPGAYFVFHAAPVGIFGEPETIPYCLRAIWLFATFGVLVLATLQPGTLLHRVFAWTPLRWLGNVSYSYYLVHGLVLKALWLVVHRTAYDAARSPGLYWAAMPLAFAVTVVGSAGVFLAIERRFSLAGAGRKVGPAVVASPRANQHSSIAV